MSLLNLWSGVMVEPSVSVWPLVFDQWMCLYVPFRSGGGTMAVEEEEKEVEEEYGDTPAGRLTQSLLMQTASHRATTNRRRPDSREYRSVSVRPSVRPADFVFRLYVAFSMTEFWGNVTSFPRCFSASASQSNTRGDCCALWYWVCSTIEMLK